MKKTLAVFAFLALGAQALGAGAVDLKGSDTLRSLTVQVIAECVGAANNLVYIGGGSGAGESALTAGSQAIAPSSRFLAGAPPAGGVCAVNTTKAEGIEIAGDSLGVWFDNGHQGPCDPGALSDLCTGYSGGGLVFNRTLSCGVTLTNWKDVLRLLYFGLRPADMPLPSSPADPNGEVSAAAVGRRDCRDSCRDELRNNFGQLFQNSCDPTGEDPDTGGCVKLQHAFRRDENSGTTDFYREALNVQGGSNVGNKGFPFCNEFIPRVTQNVQSLSRGACTVSTDCSSGYSCFSGQCRRPSSGCTVATSALDCPANSKCDPGQGLCAITCILALDPACAPLGSGARCDVAAGLCIKAVDGCSVDTDCAAGFLCDGNANGGTCSPACTPGSDTCASYLPGAACTARVSDGATLCTRAYGSICPAPGLVAANSTANPPAWAGTVAGAPGVARSIAFGGVGFENQQDNDLLRWPAVGDYNYSLAGVPNSNPAEQVASACGDLGLVLAISEPPAPELGDPNVFPTANCGRNKVAFAPAVKVQGGLSARFQLCANGDMPFGATWDATTRLATGGTGNCLHPQQASGDFRCLTGKNNGPLGRFYPPPIPLPSFLENRAFNLHVLTATGAHLTQPYAYNAGAQPPAPLASNTESIFNQNTVGAVYRLHSTRTLLAGVDALCPGGVCCQESADTQQIGCLVQASPCSLGFAGLAAGTVSLSTGPAPGTQQSTFAVGLQTDRCVAGACTSASQCGVGGTCSSGVCTGGVCASNSQCGTSGGLCNGTGSAPAVVSPNGPKGCIPNGPAPITNYPIARNLFVNSLAGFDTLGPTDPQLNLMKCFTGAQALSTTTIGALIGQNGYISLPNYPCCRDFTQEASCGQAAAPNACNDNGAVGLPTNICDF